MTTATFGTMAVDWEERLDFDRLRTDRLANLKRELEASDLGAVLAFDFANIRYMSATHIGTWAMDKLIRFSLLTRNSDPIVWDFGSAARHHELYNPWLSTTTAEMDADPHGAPPRCRSSACRDLAPAPAFLLSAALSPPEAGDSRRGRAEDQARTREVRPPERATGSRRHRASDPGRLFRLRESRSSTGSRSS